MIVVETIEEYRAVLAAARREGRDIGLVPTMGYLHAGHLSLVEASVDDGCFTTATIFVNPLQFAENEDLSAYPRDVPRDLELCETAGADVVMVPSVDELYPRPALTTVSVSEVSAGMEGDARPSHFAGVATVVAKLFNIVGPCRAYFGEKDYQQLAVVRRMASDLNMDVEVVGCPTVREPDGLAMSSRNVYLTPEQRAAAVVLWRALESGGLAVQGGERDPAAVAGLMADLIDAEPLASRDYAVVAEPDTLRTPSAIEPGQRLRLLVAARLGKPRLLDNIGVQAASGDGAPGDEAL